MDFKLLIGLFIPVLALSCRQAQVKTEGSGLKPDAAQTETPAAYKDASKTGLPVSTADSKNAGSLYTDTISLVISGDFNGDGVKEKAWFSYPNRSELLAFYNGNNPELNDKYRDNPSLKDIFLRFSNPKIPTVRVNEFLTGLPVNEGDLNGDGADEIGTLLEWYTGNWLTYHVYTLLKGKWKLAVEPIPIFWSDYYKKKIDIIKKDPRKPGFVIIKYSEVDDEFVVKTKSVRIRR